MFERRLGIRFTTKFLGGYFGGFLGPFFGRFFKWFFFGLYWGGFFRRGRGMFQGIFLGWTSKDFLAGKQGFFPGGERFCSGDDGAQLLEHVHDNDGPCFCQ